MRVVFRKSGKKLSARSLCLRSPASLCFPGFLSDRVPAQWGGKRSLGVRGGQLGSGCCRRLGATPSRTPASLEPCGSRPAEASQGYPVRGRSPMRRVWKPRTAQHRQALAHPGQRCCLATSSPQAPWGSTSLPPEEERMREVWVRSQRLWPGQGLVGWAWSRLHSEGWAWGRPTPGWAPAGLPPLTCPRYLQTDTELSKSC